MRLPTHNFGTKDVKFIGSLGLQSKQQAQNRTACQTRAHISLDWSQTVCFDMLLQLMLCL